MCIYTARFAFGAKCGRFGRPPRYFSGAGPLAAAEVGEGLLHRRHEPARGALVVAVHAEVPVQMLRPLSPAQLQPHRSL